VEGDIVKCTAPAAPEPAPTPATTTSN